MKSELVMELNNRENRFYQRTSPKCVSPVETMPNSETTVYKKGTELHLFQQKNSRYRPLWQSAIW